MFEQFGDEFSRVQNAPAAPIFYEANGQKRSINLVRVPWGTVAIILPQNAFLIVGLTAVFNGLATGNRVILRAPLQSARSALLLARALKNADVPQNAVSMVLCKSKEFVTALCESSTLPLYCITWAVARTRRAFCNKLLKPEKAPLPMARAMCGRL